MKTVFFDVDTQIDFVYPAGALYVPGAETILERIGALNRFAASQGIPLVSTIDAHGENDPEFKTWPPHCIVGTLGQRKPAATLLEKRLVVPNARPLPDLTGAQQTLLEKQALDCFTNVALPELLEHLGAERYIVYGVVTEVCVQFAALGLLNTGRQVQIVTDAVKELDASARDKMFQQFQAMGGKLSSTSEIFAR